MVLIIAADELRKLLTMEDCISALERAHVELSSGQVIMPVRSRLSNPERQGGIAMMPAVLKHTDAMGIKVQCLFRGNPERGVPLATGVIILQDAHTGVPLAIMDSLYVTAVRTAAASAMATKYLARGHSRVLAILGAGRQGRAHLWAMKVVRPIERVQVWSRMRETAERYKGQMEAEHGLPIQLFDTPEKACQDADIICTTSMAKTPIVEGRWLQPGVHINGVGSHALDTRELDSDAVAMARCLVDSMAAVPQECGDIMIPIQEGRMTLEHVVGEIGDVIAGKKPARLSENDITIYKSHGVAIQDVAAAHMVYQKAIQSGMGAKMNLQYIL